MKLNWIDRLDSERNGIAKQYSEADIINGLLTLEVYYTYDQRKDEAPWIGQIRGYWNFIQLINFKTIDEAKKAIENKLKETIQELNQLIN